MTTIRVVLADDQPLIRSALAALLAQQGVCVVAQVGDGQAAVEAVAAHRPDVVLMDIRMPVLDGLEATRRLRVEAPGVAVVILTTFDLDAYVFEAVRAGACGFLLKDGDADELVRAVRAAAQGDAVVAPTALRRLLTEFATTPSSLPAAQQAVAALTGREQEVLRLLARGLSNVELATSLFISEGTAKTHVSSVLTKLAVRDRVQAVVVAYESGMVRPGDHPL